MFRRCLRLRYIHTSFPHSLRGSSAATRAVLAVRSREDGGPEGAVSLDCDADEGHVDPSGTAQTRKVYFLNNRVLNQVISFEEAMRCLRAYSLLPSPETVELSLNINMALKKGKKREAFRGLLVFPHRFGDERKILVLAEEEALGEVSGADLSGGSELIPKLEKSPQDLDFDVCVCTPTIYEQLKHLQRILRTRMPNPRRGTVVPPEELNQAVINFQQSKAFRCSKFGTINMPVGKLDFSDSELRENVQCLLDSVAEHRGNLHKGLFLSRGTLSTQFGPGFGISLQQFI